MSLHSKSKQHISVRVSHKSSEHLPSCIPLCAAPPLFLDDGHAEVLARELLHQLGVLGAHALQDELAIHAEGDNLLVRSRDTPYEVAPPTPGTNVTKDPVHSWAGTSQRTKPNTGTPSGDDKISGNHADHIPPTFWSESDAEG